MPRTKKQSTKVRKLSEIEKQSAADTRSKVRAYIRNMDSEFLRIKQDLNTECVDLKRQISTVYNEARAKLATMKNRTLEDLEIFGLSSTQFVSLSSTASTNSVMITSTIMKEKKMQTERKGKRSRSCAEDEGYLTAGDTGSSDGKTRQSRTIKKNATTTKSSRQTRSLSRSKEHPTAVDAMLAYKTPINKQNPADHYGFVTPKVKPNTPQVILRRPKEGEMAISMQGSPLFVNAIVSSEPNVNIPLDDGRTISIQPQRGLRISQLPVMDDETKRHIEVLRDNLIKMCELSSRNKTTK